MGLQFMVDSCADPESFVRGGPTLTAFFFSFFFSLMRGGRTQIPLLAGHQRRFADWRVDDGPTMNAGLVAL